MFDDLASLDRHFYVGSVLLFLYIVDIANWVWIGAGLAPPH
jgi:hypothetical protein